VRKKNTFKKKSGARKHAKRLGLRGIHSHGRGKSKIYMAGSTHAAYERAMRNRKKRNGRK
jgi:hypothetical protein